MQITLKFSELQHFVESRLHKKLTMSHINNDSCNVNISITIPYINKTMNVGLELKVIEAKGSDITLAIDGEQATGMAMNIAFPMIQNKIGANLLEIAEGNNLVLHLGNSDKTKRFFENMDLTDITFSEDAINVSLKLRN